MMWQPNEEWCMCAGVFSFCVWHRRENGMRDHPEVPLDAWVRYQPGEIEEPTYMDLPVIAPPAGTRRKSNPKPLPRMYEYV